MQQSSCFLKQDSVETGTDEKMDWATQSPRQIYIPKISLQHVLEKERLSSIQRQNMNHG